MTNITCNIEPFKKYIHDSSAAILSEESNKKHDWKREISCSVGENEHVLNLKPAECSGDPQQDKFHFFFDIELFKVATKTEAKELLCRFADAMQFHTNIKVLDRTEHSEAIGYFATKEEPIGDDRYFWLRPEGFDFKKDKSGRYCWDEVPEDAYPWFANMVVEVRMTKSASDHLVKNFEWGRSFDLNPEALTPVSLLRQRIRERDEEIAKKKSDEETRAEEQQEAHEKLKGFLESIGDFEMHGPSSHDPDCEEAVNWLETWSARIIPFKECWNDSPLGFFVGIRGIRLEVCLSDGFDENVKKIVRWAVENGAREPQQACV
jgi:hypothetical protein